MACKKEIISLIVLLFAMVAHGQSNTNLISVGFHSNGVSIGEPVVYNKGRANVGFLNRLRGSNFSAGFYLSQDTLCQNDATQIVLQDSSFLGSKKFTLDFVAITLRMMSNWTLCSHHLILVGIRLR